MSIAAFAQLESATHREHRQKSKSGGEGRFKLLSAIRHLVYVESTIISGTRIKQNKNILPTPFLSYSTIRYEYFWFELIQNNQFLLNPSKVFSGKVSAFSTLSSSKLSSLNLEKYTVEKKVRYVRGNVFWA